MKRIFRTCILCLFLSACSLSPSPRETDFLIEYRAQEYAQSFIHNDSDLCEGDVVFYKSSPVIDKGGDSIYIPLTLKTYRTLCDTLQPVTWVVMLDRDYERLSYEWITDSSIHFRIFNPNNEEQLRLVWHFYSDGTYEMKTYQE